MQLGALRPYESALTDGRALELWTHTGGESLEVARWLEPAGLADLSVVARCAGPVLDVGCGPGRMLVALAHRGLAAVGIDIARTAVRLARRRGGTAVRRDVFATVPRAGRFHDVLLLDGNIGIGGDPGALLARCAQLVVDGGQLLVETHADDDADELITAWFSRDNASVGPSFPWARVGRAALAHYAAAAELHVVDHWTVDARTFVVLGGRLHGSS